MSFIVSTLLATLSLAGSTFAAQNNAAVLYGSVNKNCGGGTVTSTYLLSNDSQIGCGNLLGSGSTQVFGSGCATYFYTDTKCKTNYFGTGHAVPDSNCHPGVGSYSIQC